MQLKTKRLNETMLNTSANTPKDLISETSDLTPLVEEMGFQMQEEINRLEEMILENDRIPFTGKTLIDEEKLLNQLDLIRINIPDSLEQALEILRQKQQIISEAQQYAQKMVENAQKRAAQILDETRIIQQAEMQANQLRRQVQQECQELQRKTQTDCDNLQRKIQTECENLQRKTLSEVEQIRRKVQQDIMQMKQEAIAESEEIKHEADAYADAALSNLEKRLQEMLKIVHNGRQELNRNSPSLANRTENPVKKPS